MKPKQTHALLAHQPGKHRGSTAKIFGMDQYLLHRAELNTKQVAAMDPELVELICKLNRVPGVRTYDCCFGHTHEEHPFGNNQCYAFVGLYALNLKRFLKFFRFVMGFTYGEHGKVFLEGHEHSGFCLSLQAKLHPNRDGDLFQAGSYSIRLEIAPLTVPFSRQEKLAGIEFLCRIIDAYLSGTMTSSQDVGIKHGVNGMTPYFQRSM
jgi:hypothetical protein